MRIWVAIVLILTFKFSASQDLPRLQTVDSLKKAILEYAEGDDYRSELEARLYLIDYSLEIIQDINLAYKEALKAESRSKELNREMEFWSLYGKLYYSLGFIYNNQFQYERSNKYFEKYLKLLKQKDPENSKVQIFDLLGKIAFNYYLNGEKNKAFNEIERTKKLAYQTKNSQIIADVNYYLYCIYLGEDVDKALNYSRLSLHTPVIRDSAHRLINLGTCFLDLKQLDSSLYYTQKAEEISIKHDLYQQEAYSYLQLSNIYAGLGDYKKSYDYNNDYKKLINKRASFDSAMELVGFNLKMQEEQLALQKKLAQEKISNQKNIIWLSIGTTIMVVIILLYLFNRIKIIKKQNIIIAREKARAEESERHKDEFLANVSHEIRTPMNAINGMLNSLNRRKHSEYQDKYFKVMKRSLENLLVIVDDVLDLSKIEYGKLEIRDTPIQIRELVQGVVNFLKIEIEEKNLIINTCFCSDFPEVILGDPVRLNQILTNLLGNAIKFTRIGSINIVFYHNINIYNFSVEDTGPGIPEDQLETIFESFNQGSSMEKSPIRGTGLGLSITRKLVELQGGKIMVESEMGRGSKFTVELPLRISDTKGENVFFPTETELRKKGLELKGIKLLIAEDNEFNIMVLKDDLQWYIPEVGFCVVENGLDALDMFRNKRFDIILMDIQMPELDGFDTTRKIREIESRNGEDRIPIIAMTASLLKTQIERYYEAGMDGYIPKPYRLEELLSKLHQFYKEKIF